MHFFEFCLEILYKNYGWLVVKTIKSDDHNVDIYFYGLATKIGFNSVEYYVNYNIIQPSFENVETANITNLAWL